jgi:hypothetical protein
MPRRRALSEKQVISGRRADALPAATGQQRIASPRPRIANDAAADAVFEQRIVNSKDTRCSASGRKCRMSADDLLDCSCPAVQCRIYSGAAVQWRFGATRSPSPATLRVLTSPA